MKVPMGAVELEVGGKYLDLNLRGSNDLVGNPAAQRERMKEDGYLFFRGLQDRQNVLRGRQRILEYIDAQGSILPGTILDEAMVNFEGKYANTMGRRGITHEPEVRAVL